MKNPRLEAILCILREEYGITTVEELLEAVRTMKKLDITQFVYPVNTGGESRPTQGDGAAAGSGPRLNRGRSRQSPV